MSQEFIKELERLKAKQAEQGSPVNPLSLADAMRPYETGDPYMSGEAHSRQKEFDGMFGVNQTDRFNKFAENALGPRVGPGGGIIKQAGNPTLASEVQPDAMASTFDVQAPSIQPETPLFQSAESGQSPVSAVIPRGGVRTRGTGGQKPAMAAARTGGIAESDTELGFLDTLRTVVNPSDEQVAANLAAGARTGGVQVLPEEPSVAANPMGATPEVMATPESIADLSVNGTDVVTPEAITEAAPKAQIPGTIQNSNVQDLIGFKPKYEGQSLTDFMAGRDDPSAASVQVQDPQGRFRRQATPVAGETPEQNKARTDSLFPEQAAFEQASADREARQAARPDFGAAVSDRERRAARGDGISDADRRDIAKANQRGASASDIARGDKVAALNGIDRKTGKPLEGVSGKELAETGKIRAETAKILSEIGEKSTELDLSPAEQSRDKTAGTALAKWDDSGRATVTSNITSLDSIVKGLEDGQIKTRGFIDALPFASDWARAIVNPKAQDAKNRVEGVIFHTLKETLGAQFTEEEGKRLVEASYNPMLSPEANAARLRDYSNGLKRAAAARESQMAYLKENKTLQGYDGATPEGIMSQVGAGEGGAGEGGSPIKGDVNYRSATQSKADQILSAQ